MALKSNHSRIVILCVLLLVILFLHYFTLHDLEFHHAIYRTLFYLPLVLGSFWFGLKGAAGVSISVILFYLPYATLQWQGLQSDFEVILEGGLYVFIALILGYLAEKERKEQAAMRRVEKLAAIGKAVSEIAHDMKTPLMTIGGFSRQVERNLNAKSLDQKKLKIIVSETSRLESMVREMLDFGKPLVLNRTEIQLNDIAQDCVTIAEPEAREAGIRLELQTDPSLPPITLDRSRVKQVLLNLIVNAIQASPPGEEVIIRTNMRKDSMRVEVSDRGHGISEDGEERVFEPFFTTKRNGTGLGLSIVKQIVEAHGGEISFSRNSTKGVTFRVSLPFNQQSAR
ncbi:MAG: hypothetical protein JW932_06060 [Deltaproteobacteria bacterium]|nr:hypothetical protein [Deltaproteobacteria bacterium]